MCGLAAGLSSWWFAGWAIGFGGAIVAALLLVAIVRLAARIRDQAREATAAIDAARENALPLFDVARANLALDRAARALRDGGR